MASYTNIKLADLGAGIDQESVENRIQPGFVEDAENADPQAQGHVQKRAGYQGYAGNVPVRVKEVIQTSSPSELCFILEDSVNLSAVRSSPIIVKGKFSNTTSGDFPSDEYNTRYYSAFDVDIRRTFDVGTNSDSMAQSDHDITSDIFWTGAASSDSQFNNSNTQFFLDSTSIDQATGDLTYTYTNGTGSAFTGFIFLKAREDASGSVYNSTPTTIGTGTNTYSIPVGTHGLSNQNILVRVFEDTGSAYVELIPDAVVIDTTTGDVDVTLTNGTGSAFDAVFSLASAPSPNFETGNIGGMGSVSVSFSTLGESPFSFVGCYLRNGTDLEQVLPDSIVTDTDTSLTTVTFTNNSSTGRIFYVFWDFATIATNQLCVTPQEGAFDLSDTSPQLTIWGLDHLEIYGDSKSDHEGWTNHIDSYRSLGESRLISGLGGNIFSAQSVDEGSNETEHLMPTLYPRLNATLGAELVVGPAFWDSGETPTRTRGYITGDEGGTNTYTVTSVEYDSGNTWVKYTLSVPNLVISGTLSTILSSTSGMEDRLTTTQCGWGVHNGEFVIKQATSGVDELYIWVDNSTVTSSDYDELDAGGFAGVFTDRLSFTGSAIPPFLPEDVILSGIFSEEDGLTAVNSQVMSGTPTTLISGLTTQFELPNALRVTSRRTSSVIPLRTLTNSTSVTNLVRGDMLSYSEVSRLLRIKYINAESNITISDISGDGENATVTISGADTSHLAVGGQILILGSSSYSGVQTISDILSTTEFTISSESTETGETGTILGMTVQVDEQLEFEDTELSTNIFRVEERWIPVEFPEDEYNLTPVTKPRYFDADSYGSQSILRSTMVQDSLFLTNGTDEVYKFDGADMYRAGLFRWQPHVFINLDNSTTGKIDINPITTSYSAANTSLSRYTIPFGSEVAFSVGDTIRDGKNGASYVVTKISEDGSNGFLFVDRTIDTSGVGGTNLVKAVVFRYYFRLNAVDANNNIVASAVTGADDTYFRLYVDAGIRLRLVGMPAWDTYDYDRLEVEVYRTKGDSLTPFYRVATIPMSFNRGLGYIDYLDTDSDSDLRSLDEVNTALKGAELGTAWTEPLRAKYTTSADNRLVLANIKDYPQLDVKLVKNSEVLSQSVFTNASNNTWLIRRDSTDTGTSNNLVDRASFKFIDVTDGTQSFSISVGNLSYDATGKQFTLSTANTAAVGTWIYIFHSSAQTGNTQLRFAGWWQVAEVDSGVSMTMNADLGTSNITSVAADCDKFLLDSAVNKSIPVSIGTDNNYGMVNGNTIFVGYEFLAMRRLANAVNAVMRVTDVTISGYETFKPWVIAGAGNEFGTGALTLRQPRVEDVTIELVIPALSGAFDVFVNSVRRTGGSSASALTREFPSRLIFSYPNYSEIFDAPTAALDIDSDSAVDVNPADGQDITAIIPFFGESAFGAAQKSGIVVVFKTHSIYLVDISAKAQGLPAVQKLETHGNGCTAPYSVAYTKNGIMFANEAGIFRLGRDLKVEPVGDKYGRKWKEQVNKNFLEVATGTHDADASSYKLSYPVNSDEENSLVAVYNHMREGVTSQFGSWTTYTNHPATGWANLFNDSYFANTSGRVFSLRKLGEVSDFRDDSSPVEFNLTLAATDFGDSGIRKIVHYVTTHFRAVADTSGTQLLAAADLVDQFDVTDAFQINQNIQNTGIGDPGVQKISTIQSSLKKKKLVYLQLRYINSTLDEPVVIAGVDFYVAGLNPRGITQAGDSSSR